MIVSKNLMPLFYVSLGGGLGAGCRFLIMTAAHHGSNGPAPWSTVAVNLLGSCLLAALMTSLSATPAAAHWLLFLGPGVLGGFTTFSTFSWETLTLVRSGQMGTAILYAGASVGGGILGAYIVSGALSRP